jgi:T-complex protein 1 subunit alpha
MMTVMACQSIANVVKSSLGPVGLDKMLVDDIGDTTVTNDGATILNLLEVDHPAGKVLVELAQLQVISRTLLWFMNAWVMLLVCFGA